MNMPTFVPGPEMDRSLQRLSLLSKCSALSRCRSSSGIGECLVRIFASASGYSSDTLAGLASMQRCLSAKASTHGLIWSSPEFFSAKASL